MIQNAGRLAGLNQIAVQIVEIKWKFTEGNAEGSPGFDVGTDVVEQPGDARIRIASPYDVERLQ